MNGYVRALIFIIVYVGLLVLPWWLSVIILFCLNIYFPIYWEILFFGFIIDSLYAVNYGFPYTGLTTAFILLAITVFVKTQIRK